MISPGAVLTRVRERRPFVDHLVRTVGRYQADAGDRLAAGVTFYWFLSLFPILLLAISVLGFVLGDGAQKDVSDALAGILPGQLVATIGTVISNSKGKAGVIGLIGLLLSGLGWVDALREAIRSIWHQNVTAGNFVTRKVLDVLVLLGLFGTVAASVLVTGAATAATGFVLDLLGVAKTAPAKVLTSVLTYVLAGFADTVLFLYLFTRLSRVRSPLRRVLKGAVFGAFGFEVVKFLGAFYVARTTTKGEATYGTFAVVVGLLLFLNLVSRLILLTAAFTVTAPYDSDVAPSGTADVEQARKAGIPEQYADNDPDDPPALRKDGAPTTLQPAVVGRTPPQDEPEGRGSLAEQDPAAHAQGPSGSDGQAERVPVTTASLGTTAAIPAGRPDEARVQLAARATAGVIGLGVAGLGVYAARTLGRLVRR